MEKIVIIGGVAAGPKVASRIMRMHPNAQVTVIERGLFLSYAGCGLPYYVSGVVKEQKELMATPVGVVRDPVFFQKVKDVTVLNRTEAFSVDRSAKEVRIRSLESGEESTLPYDKLVLATGASSFLPPLPGGELEHIYSLYKVEDAEAIRSLLAEDKARDVVVMGGGLIGVEITEALVERGCRVTIVEMLPQLMRMLDAGVARLVEQHMEAKGVRVLTNTTVLGFGGTQGRVNSVKTTAGDIPADMVVTAVGVRPTTHLASEAGLEIGSTRGIVVDEQMRTSDPDIFAAGDCTEMRHIVTGAPCYVPLGSTANKTGRVAANAICGISDRFPGVLGTTVCKVFDYCVGCTGLTEQMARDHGFDPLTVLAPAPDRAHYMPTAKPVFLKMVADRTTRRLLGIQVAGPGAGDKRIDIAATAITAGMTVDQVAQLDISYAPPFNSAMDNLITAANIARNKLDGQIEGISPEALKDELDAGKDLFLLDNRSPAEFDEIRLAHAVNIPLGALRTRLEEIPRDRPVVCYCKISLRGYEGALILKKAGFQDVRVLDGGLLMWPYEKEK